MQSDNESSCPNQFPSGRTQLNPTYPNKTSHVDLIVPVEVFKWNFGDQLGIRLLLSNCSFEPFINPKNLLFNQNYKVGQAQTIFKQPNDKLEATVAHSVLREKVSALFVPDSSCRPNLELRVKRTTKTQVNAANRFRNLTCNACRKTGPGRNVCR